MLGEVVAATSHSSRATQTRGDCIGSAVLRFCSVCVCQSGDRKSGVGASVASHMHNSFVSNSDSSASGTSLTRNIRCAKRKLSSHRCLVRLDSVIGERGRSSFSMVDSEDSSD